MDFLLEIDTRETKIKGFFQQLDETLKQKYRTEVKSLDIGDFIFKNRRRSCFNNRTKIFKRPICFYKRWKTS